MLPQHARSRSVHHDAPKLPRAGWLAAEATQALVKLDLLMRCCAGVLQGMPGFALLLLGLPLSLALLELPLVQGQQAAQRRLGVLVQQDDIRILNEHAA